ncbi:16S rRNA (guanine(527)-N(7))-methyltransferase RsmG [Halomonas sp. 18H]|uniref:16S rRNA (guanine(527)-N(7))-methyltransferase RsmG n=1 Tax=Halomonas almeriensis TaxID=308163 RepID=UPI0022324838|nr:MULTISPECIES: 16S rRNA (guanine(527)-N(7))-methyltransferase RsmG [Halomonas]MCW4152079.1 16S rRNA (guanine(527)-N(7))-methyltransferase RsmG [Halomonas sp. 18H]MDN3552516.1 16S rRNA (guanine(527)-N(7))-methyltransferase RsmG [Halomonas almeriensis]
MRHDDRRVHERLEQGLAELGLADRPRVHEVLMTLLALLHKWNRAYNLTAVRSRDDMVSRHLLDSAVVAPYLNGSTLLDVGSGPGLPGLVLAILAPERRVTLLDSNGKKVRFQRQAVMELGLTNVTPVQARVEAFAGPAYGYDAVISRAFASLGDFVSLSTRLVADGGRWLAMKGPTVEDELSGLPEDVTQVASHELRVPFEAGQRRLVILERTASTQGRH